MRTTLVAVTLLLLLSPFLSAQDLPEDAASLPISHLLSLASQALINGKSTSALSIYDHCLERDPSDFATLYKRATLRLATGQFGKAREGFAEVLRVREFDQAHWQLAKLNAKVGEFEEAIREVDVFIKGRKVKEGVEWEEAIELRAQVVKAQSDLVAAEAALASGQLQPCLDHSTSALLTSPNSERLRLVRAECYFLSGDYDSNIGDLSRAAALSPALPPYLLLRISFLSAFFLDNGMEIPTDSLQSIKRCLSSDPDSKGCRSAFKAFKALEKELAKLRNWVEGGRWTEAAVILAGSSNSDGVIHTVKTLLATYQLPLPSSPNSPAPLIATNKLDHASPLLNSLLSTLCRAYISLGQTKKSGTACEAILERRPDDIWGLVGKGERLSAEENWEEAVRVLNDAFEASGKSDRDILGRLQKAQRLLKQSTAKDYYKVLGVARDADKKTIKRAYRKATLKNHPDKAGGSESKMASVNEAYEVLSNPELRQRFDNGEDPNDPAAQQQGGFQQGGGFNHAFFHQQAQQQGQQFFQQGGFNFKFG